MDKPTLLPTGTAVYITGEGEPLVIIGGGPGISSRIYRNYLVPQLAGAFKVICFDYAGVGNSNRREDYSFAADYQDFWNVFDSLKLEKAHILAHSYGSLSAIKFAKENPQKVSSLTLVGASAGFAGVLAEYFERKLTRLSQPEFQEMMGILEKMIGGQATESEVLRFDALELRCQMLNLTPEQAEQLAPETEFNPEVFLKNQDWMTEDFTSQLSSLDVKTWVVTSTNDINVPPQFSEPLRSIPNVRWTEFRNSAHSPFIEEAPVFIPQFLSFAKSAHP